MQHLPGRELSHRVRVAPSLRRISCPSRCVLTIRAARSSSSPASAFEGVIRQLMPLVPAGGRHGATRRPWPGPRVRVGTGAGRRTTGGNATTGVRRRAEAGTGSPARRTPAAVDCHDDVGPPIRRLARSATPGRSPTAAATCRQNRTGSLSPSSSESHATARRSSRTTTCRSRGLPGRAGVPKQTIYRWWPSKAALVLDMWSPEVAEHFSFPDTGDVADDLTAQIAAVVGLVEIRRRAPPSGPWSPSPNTTKPCPPRCGNGSSTPASPPARIDCARPATSRPAGR